MTITAERAAPGLVRVRCAGCLAAALLVVPAGVLVLDHECGALPVFDLRHADTPDPER